MLNTILKSSPSGRAQRFSQNAILCSIISREILALFNDTDEWKHTIV